jgi:hypothetical protein
MRFIPSWQQFKNWSIPSRITFLSGILALIAIFFAILFFIIQSHMGASRKKQEETQNKLSKIDAKISDLAEETIPRSEIVKKSLKQKEKDLSESLALLEDALEKVQGGDDNYFKIISGQLRALICFGSRSLSPLLFNLAEENSIELECYGYSVREPLEGLVLAINPGIAVSVANPQRPSIGKSKFKKWLDKPYLALHSYLYTPNEVIRMVAEKEGGAHYDDAMPEKLIKIKEIMHHKSGAQYNEVEKLLFQTSKAVMHYGELVLSKN